MMPRADGETLSDDETRAAPRKRVLLSGKIAYGGGIYSQDCTIRDISTSGAKLGIRGATILPKTFFLINLKQSMAFECEMVWRNASQCGVKFHNAHDLAKITDPDLRFLRVLYIEACQR